VDQHWGVFIAKSDGSDVRRLTSPDSDFVWGSCSVDGRFVAYIHTIRPPGARLPTTKLFVAGTDGRGAHELFGDTASRSAPSWSPDGRTLAYTKRDGVTRNVYVADATGAHERQVTRGEVVNQNPQWSRDGTKLVYFSMRVPAAADSIYSVNVATGLEESTGLAGVYPTWGAPRETVIFGLADSVFTAPAHGDVRTLLVGMAFFPSLSPDGSEVAVVSKADTLAQAIWIIKVNGTQPRRILSGQALR
jgi:dipeptidyl aminopeptidase/acylaminoacyl peptidase